MLYENDLVIQGHRVSRPSEFRPDPQVLVTFRLKTYLSNTVNQRRLNHLAVLHVHQDRLDVIDTTVIAREFVSKCEARQMCIVIL